MPQTSQRAAHILADIFGSNFLVSREFKPKSESEICCCTAVQLGTIRSNQGKWGFRLTFSSHYCFPEVTEKRLSLQKLQQCKDRPQTENCRDFPHISLIFSYFFQLFLTFRSAIFIFLSTSHPPVGSFLSLTAPFFIFGFIVWSLQNPDQLKRIHFTAKIISWEIYYYSEGGVQVQVRWGIAGQHKCQKLPQLFSWLASVSP